MSSRRTAPSIAFDETEGYVYVSGGYYDGDDKLLEDKGNDYLRTVERFSLRNKTWEVIPGSMSQCQGSVLSVVLKNKLYLFGGDDSTESDIVNCDIYDIASKKWQASKLTLPEHRHESVAITLSDEEVVFLGGKRTNGNFSEVGLLFDSSTNTFSKLPPIPNIEYQVSRRGSDRANMDISACMFGHLLVALLSNGQTFVLNMSHEERRGSKWKEIARCTVQYKMPVLTRYGCHMVAVEGDRSVAKVPMALTNMPDLHKNLDSNATVQWKKFVVPESTGEWEETGKDGKQIIPGCGSVSWPLANYF
eukprot:g1747.t1